MDIVYEMSVDMLEGFRLRLTEEEKSRNTVERYLRDVRAFYLFLSAGGKAVVSKLRVMEFKEKQQETDAPVTVNAKLTAVNSFLKFMGWQECRVKMLKIQRRIFRDESKELTKAEYVRLVNAAKRKGNGRLALLLETICSTGIRVSELRYITVEAAQIRKAEINCKGKRRVIFLPAALCQSLLRYARERQIASDYIFRTRSGKPLDRSNIHHDMKKMCEMAGVEQSKVFPHNLRHLFAFTFYAVERNLVHLADILGHSSVNTTRIYTISSGEEHAKEVERLGLIV